MLFQLKINLRNLRRGGIYSVINIGGLAIGMAATIIIMLWVYNQWSYDRFHAKDKYLYKVWCHNEVDGNFDKVSTLIGPSLLDEYAGFANMTRYMEIELPLMSDGEDDVHLSFSVESSRAVVATVDTGFLRMFSFPLLRGNASTVLSDPYSVVITQNFSRRLFGENDPMDKTILMNGNVNFKVAGILADLPDNTNFGFDVLVPFKWLSIELDLSDTWWNKSNFYTYVELSHRVDAKTAGASVRDVISKHTDGRHVTETFLQHISGWHLYSNFDRGIPVGGRIETLRMIGLIALLILVIACINFMNITTAQSSKYAKEVGVRKIIGARRLSLILRFLGESVMIAAFAGVCALYLVLICLPFFNAMVGENLTMNAGNGVFWIVWAIFVVITGIFAGSYPSFYLSSFLPLKVLKGVFNRGRSLITPRKILIVTQFTFAAILITATLVVHRQIQYAKARQTGYDRERLVNIMITDRTRATRELIRRELLETGVAESVSVNFASMTESESKLTDMRWRGKDPERQIVIERNYAEADWAKTTGVQIVQGRDIDVRAYPTDSTAMLLNESAVKAMGFDDPIGEIVYEWGVTYHVVGVVKDFVLESPFDPIRPMAIGGPANGWHNNINIKLSAGGSLAEKLGQVEMIHRKFNPDDPFIYSIADEAYARRFDREQRISSLVTWFAALAVFISCLGLFGLSAYMAENRRKEIGIRKVLGASIFNIVSLLSKEFLVLVSISLAIALPVAWWAMNQWLMGYAYRTDIPWWLLVAVAVLTIAIALGTVSVQAIKAATENPVKAIKSE